MGACTQAKSTGSERQRSPMVPIGSKTGVRSASQRASEEHRKTSDGIDTRPLLYIDNAHYIQ
jgi:hypothetical protein